MVPRMRTINEAITTLRELDPESGFTQTALRNKIRSGEIRSIKVGRKYLVNLDELIGFLSSQGDTGSPTK